MVSIRLKYHMNSRPAERLTIAPARTLVFGNAKIEDTCGLILDPATGKYATRSQMTAELERAVNLACQLWGADTPWADIHEAHFTALLRVRTEQLVAKGCRAVRACEITVSRLVTAVAWMREMRHIPRDAAPWPKRYKELIRQHWKSLKGTSRDPMPHRPRHSLEEVRKILRSSNFDPRFELLCWLGLELRMGQVARCQRSDLTLPPVDWNAPETADIDYGTLEVWGAGKKGGTTVDLTRGQRRRVDDALSAGYLADIEAKRLAGEVEDYCLYPAGYAIGRVGFTRGKAIPVRMGAVNWQKNVHASWIRQSWRYAEKRAGVPHVVGRCAYGARRQGRDVADVAGLSQSAVENFGGWQPGSDIANKVYRERENRVGRREARPARAMLRGENVA